MVSRQVSGNAPLVGSSPELRRILSAARMVAPTDVNVLIVGEGGTGRQSLAREIHRLGRHPAAPCVTVGCSGLGADSLRHQLESGARTTAATLILTEVADLPAESQAVLLQHLALGETMRTPSHPGLRVIATTSRDLAAEVGLGAFRRDLYYRICVVPLELPPLRERAGDISTLIAAFGAEAARAHGHKPPRYTAMALRMLNRYTWPGNIRELRNLCERMAILAPGRELAPEDLPLEIRRGDPPRSVGAPIQLPPTGIDLNTLEAELIRQALALAAGNKSRAARLLGLTRDTLLYRIEKHLIKA